MSTAPAILASTERSSSLSDLPVKDCDRDTLFLMPPSVDDWVPESHLSRFVVDIANRLYLSSIVNAYAGRGSNAFPPSMMVALPSYAYATGLFFSRKIERATYDSVAFRYIAANMHPDHDTIASFRKRFLEELKKLFVQILLIAHEMGILKLGSVSLNGTKIKANASKHHALSWDYARKMERFTEPDPLIGPADSVTKMTHRLKTIAGKMMVGIKH